MLNQDHQMLLSMCWQAPSGHIFLLRILICVLQAFSLPFWGLWYQLVPRSEQSHPMTFQVRVFCWSNFPTLVFGFPAGSENLEIWKSLSETVKP
jgi:hypothetical protein